MLFRSVADFFPQGTFYRYRHVRRPLLKLENAKWQELEADMIVEGITFASGSAYKVFETQNFGWVVFRGDALTPNGETPGRRIFKW